MRLHRVSTFSELEGAWHAQAEDDTTILVTQRIPFSGEWLGPVANDKSLLIYFNDEGGFDFEAVYPGAEREPRNGIEYRGRHLRITGGLFENYNCLGAAIRGDNPEAMEILGSTFRNIGTVAYPPMRSPVQQATDTVYTQAVACFSDEASVLVNGCHFSDCALNSFLWSHCLYLKVDRVIVTQCHFSSCGSPFALSAPTERIVANCSVIAPSLCNHAEHSWDHSFLFYSDEPEPQPLIVVGNRFAGDYRTYVSLIGAMPEPCIFANDITQMMEPSKYFARVGGDLLSREEWKALGHDKNTIHWRLPQ